MEAEHILLTLIAVTIVAAYLYIRRLYSYWDRHGIESIKPSFPFGNMARNVFQKVSIGELSAEIYNSSTEPFVGIINLLRPALVLRDPSLIRQLCGKDFNSCFHRGFHLDEAADPMAKNLLVMNGEKWKSLREKLSPTFTSGRIKGMFNTIVDCGNSLHKHIDKYANNNEIVEIRDVFARYATNVIASVAFGLSIDCIENPDEEFRKRGQQIFDLNFRNALRQLLTLFSPTICKIFGVRFVDKEVELFMRSVVKQNLEYRLKTNTIRKDFFQLLI